jgi:acyl carrier protein
MRGERPGNLRGLVLADSLIELREQRMNADIYATLTSIFREVFRREGIVLKAEMAGEDIPGWNSFKLVEIVHAVEERFGIILHTKELDSLHTVGDLVDLIAGKTKLPLNQRL